jgi:hypothetical protein
VPGQHQTREAGAVARSGEHALSVVTNMILQLLAQPARLRVSTSSTTLTKANIICIKCPLRTKAETTRVSYGAVDARTVRGGAGCRETAVCQTPGTATHINLQPKCLPGTAVTRHFLEGM